MLDDIVHALFACRSEREFWRVHIKAENALTPLEITALIDFSHRLPRQSRLWLKGLTSLGRFDTSAPQRFCRQPIAPNIDLYRDPFVPSEQKQLIIAFCGSAHRLMMPIACVLQYLPSNGCDLVLLRDPMKMSYTLGIPPYADSLPALAFRLAAGFRGENYRRIVCYGTSMGGFVALQCGLLLKAAVAISICGRFAWHPSRLLRDRTRPVPAFDPFCVCNIATTTELVCYHSAHAMDMADATLLARMLPIKRIAVPDSTEHNVILALWDKGQLGDFYDDLFKLPDHGARLVPEATVSALA
jgi:hypothetical protein